MERPDGGGPPAVLMAAFLALVKLNTSSSCLVRAVGWKEVVPRRGHMVEPSVSGSIELPPPEGVEV